MLLRFRVHLAVDAICSYPTLFKDIVQRHRSKTSFKDVRTGAEKIQLVEHDAFYVRINTRNPERFPIIASVFQPALKFIWT
jgi:hypothetical protein